MSSMDPSVNPELPLFADIHFIVGSDEAKCINQIKVFDLSWLVGIFKWVQYLIYMKTFNVSNWFEINYEYFYLYTCIY